MSTYIVKVDNGKQELMAIYSLSPAEALQNFIKYQGIGTDDFGFHRGNDVCWWTEKYQNDIVKTDMSQILSNTFYYTDNTTIYYATDEDGIAKLFPSLINSKT